MFDVLLLTPCVISVFVEGSPFRAKYIDHTPVAEFAEVILNVSPNKAPLTDNKNFIITLSSDYQTIRVSLSSCLCATIYQNFRIL